MATINLWLRQQSKTNDIGQVLCIQINFVYTAFPLTGQLVFCQNHEYSIKFDRQAKNMLRNEKKLKF